MVSTNSPVVRTLVLLAAFSTLGAARSPVRFPNRLDNSDLIDLLDAELDESFKLDGALLKLTEVTAAPTITPLGPEVDPPTPQPSAVGPSTLDPIVSTPGPTPVVGSPTPEPSGVDPITGAAFTASPTSSPTPSFAIPSIGLTAPPSSVASEELVSSAVSGSRSLSAMVTILLVGVISWVATIA